VLPQSYRCTLDSATLKMGATSFFKVNNPNKKKQGLTFQNTALFIFLSVKTTNFINCWFMTCTETLIKKSEWKIKCSDATGGLLFSSDHELQVSADEPPQYYQRVYILI